MNIMERVFASGRNILGLRGLTTVSSDRTVYRRHTEAKTEKPATLTTCSIPANSANPMPQHSWILSRPHFAFGWTLGALSVVLLPNSPANAQSGGTPSQTQGPALAPLMVAPLSQAAQLDSTYGLKGWNVPFPSFGDTIMQDDGGFRSRLAGYGVGFLAYDLDLSAVNTLGNPRRTNGRQAYWGQSPSNANVFNMYLTYDLSRIGISGGQLQIASSVIRSTWDPYFPDAASVYRLAYYQTLFNKSLEINIGYMGNSFSFVGIYVGGQLQNPFGPSASIPVELGLGSGSAVQPTAWANYHFLGDFYNKVGIARSISPTASSLVNENIQNPTGLNFTEAGTGALYVDEVGYKHPAAPGIMSTWIRLGSIYNNSRYHDYATAGESSNFGFYGLADRQLWQSASSSPHGAGRGLYAGISAMYAAPETNLFTQYYEARLYALGMFGARPKDTISIVYDHQVVSKYFVDSIGSASPRTSIYPRKSSNSITGSYTFNITKGLYVTTGLGYTDHPSATYVFKEGSALNFLASLFVSF